MIIITKGAKIIKVYHYDILYSKTIMIIQK